MQEENKKNKEEEAIKIDNTVDDDVVFEETEEGALLSDPKKTIGKLKERLKECEDVKNQYLDDLHRAKADFVNTARRNDESNKTLIKFANQNLIMDIIPVLDSFDMAFSNKKSWESVAEGWRSGIKNIYSQFLGILENAGIKQLSPMDEKFNPETHEILETVETDKKENDHKIIAVIQKGYSLYGKVIRPAKVKVAEYKSL